MHLVHDAPVALHVLLQVGVQDAHGGSPAVEAQHLQLQPSRASGLAACVRHWHGCCMASGQGRWSQARKVLSSLAQGLTACGPWARQHPVCPWSLQMFWPGLVRCKLRAATLHANAGHGC